MLMLNGEFDACSSRYTGALPREMKKEATPIPGIYNTGGDVSTLSIRRELNNK
jgi:hypothetical protein